MFLQSKKIYLVILTFAILMVLIKGISYQKITGFNYNLYNYHASLYFEGKNPYILKSPTVYTGNDLYKNSYYLDYSGLQLCVYIACSWVSKNLNLNGYVLYSMGLLLITLFFIYKLNELKIVGSNEYILFVVLLIFFPALWNRLFVPSYEDKMMWLASPVFLLFLWHKSKQLSFFSLGILTGLFGIPIAWLPLFLIQLLFEQKNDNSPMKRVLDKEFLVSVGFFMLGFIISILPFFPESINGWINRSHRDGSAKPFWFSIFWIVEKYYVTNLNKLLTAITLVAIYIGFYLKQFTFKSALLIASSITIFWSIYQGPQRIVPLVILLVLAFEQAFYRYVYAVLAMVFLLFQSRFFNAYPATAAEATGYALLLHSPIIVAYLLIAFDQFGFKKRNRAPLSFSQHQGKRQSEIPEA